MAASQADISTWFDKGVTKGATHMLVVCDTFEWEDFPVYVLPGEDPRAQAALHDGPNMERLMEVYNLSLPKDAQLHSPTQRRVFNY